MKKQTKAAKGNGSGNDFEEMVAIQLNVKFWPGQAKLKPADLGLDPQDVPEIFYLGNKKLYPQEIRQQFGQLSNKARNFLNDHSYPFIMDYVRAIPKRNLARMVDRLEELRAEFLAKAQEFLADYDATGSVWRTAACRAWRGWKP